MTQRPDGTWRARVLLGGKRLEKRVLNRKAGLDWIGLQVDAWEATGAAPMAGTPTLDVWLRGWLDRIAMSGKRHGKGGPRTANTVNEYRKKVESYLIPAMGTMKLTEIKPMHIVGWQKSMLIGEVPGTSIKLGRGDGLSSRTVIATQVLLKAALDDAVRQEVLRRNPVRAVDDVKLVVTYKPIIVTREQWRQGIDIARSRLSSMGIYVLLAAMIGMRRGEILGLKWVDVKLDEKHPWMQVGESVQRVGRQGLVTSPGKNDYSIREIALPPTIAAALCEIRQSSGYVVTGEAKREPAEVSRHAWDPIRNELGLPQLRLHEMRHFLVTALDGNPRITQPLVKAWFGHTPTDIHGLVYFARLREDSQRVAAQIEKLYQRA